MAGTRKSCSSSAARGEGLCGQAGAADGHVLAGGLFELPDLAGVKRALGRVLALDIEASFVENTILSAACVMDALIRDGAQIVPYARTAEPRRHQGHPIVPLVS